MLNDTLYPSLFKHQNLDEIRRHHFSITRMGEKESMTTEITGEDIWRGNELTPSPTNVNTIPIPSESGENMSVVSESVNDTAAGTGCRTICIEYLDSTGAEQKEIVTMNGTTPVVMAATDIRFINDMYTLTVGSNGVFVGHCKIYKTGATGTVYNMIAAGGNKSLVANYMVPVNKEFHLEGWHASEAQTKRCAFRLRSTDMYGILIPGVFCFKSTAYIKGDPTGTLPCPVIIPALSIVKVSGWPDASGAEGSCAFWGQIYKAIGIPS